MILGLLFAVMLNKDIYCKKLFRCLVLIPWVIPNAIAGIIWKWFLNESFGMMNYLLKQIGLINHNRLSRSHCWREFRQFLLIFTKLQRWTGRKKVSVSVSLPYRCCRTSCWLRRFLHPYGTLINWRLFRWWQKEDREKQPCRFLFIFTVCSCRHSRQVMRLLLQLWWWSYWLFPALFMSGNY